MKDLLERMQLEKVLCPCLKLAHQSLIMHTKYCISNFQDEREILFFKKLQACLATQVGNQKSLQLEQKRTNHFTPKISLVIFPTFCDTSLTMLVWRICYWIILATHGS